MKNKQKLKNFSPPGQSVLQAGSHQGLFPNLLKTFSKGFRGSAQFPAQGVKRIRRKANPHIFVQLKIKRIFWYHCLKHHAPNIDRDFYAMAVVCPVDDSPLYSASFSPRFKYQQQSSGFDQEGETKSWAMMIPFFEKTSSIP